MSFASDYQKLRKKRLEEEEKNGKKTLSLKYSSNNLAPIGIPNPSASKSSTGDIAPVYSSIPTANSENIAPTATNFKEAADYIYSVAKRKKEKEESQKKDTWLQAGAFDDGYQFGDVFKTILGTAGDVASGVAQGALKLGEGAVDLGMQAIGGGLDLVGLDDAGDALKNAAIHETVDTLFQPLDDLADKNSLLGNKTEAFEEGLGQILGIVGTGGLAGAAGLGSLGVGAVTTGVTGASAWGSGMSEAYKNGATDGEAWAYGAMSGAISAITELAAGGLGQAVKAIGLSKGAGGVDDMIAKKLGDAVGKFVSKRTSNEVIEAAIKNLAEVGVKATGEGLEELAEGIGSALAKKATYMSEEDLGKLLKDEKLFESFLVGAVTSGMAQSGYIPGLTKNSWREASSEGRDYVSGLTENEEIVVDAEVEKRASAEEEKTGEKLSKKEKSKIYDKVVEDLDKGYISIDTIEEALGGDSYKAYRDSVDAEDSIMKELETLRNEYTELNKLKRGEMTGEQVDRQNEIRDKLVELKTKYEETQANSQKNELKRKLSEDVFNIAKDSRLVSSYVERENRGKVFEADLTKYDEKTSATVQKAIDSGILNNTNRTHEFVETIAKISAESGVSFDFANNKKLAESGFAVDGATINGVVTKDGITLNIDSPKAWESTVGHEITHVLEGTELYNELQKSIFEYAKTKGDYDARLEKLTKLYENVEGADINAELTADLVGDYLFTDGDFITNLSTKNRNVFEKIYDEIKRLVKMVTPGTKEAKQLDEVKRVFDRAYKEIGKTNTADTKDGGTKYKLIGKTEGGIEVYETSEDVMSLTWDERKEKYLDVMKNEYRGRTAKFERNGHTYYAEFDKDSLRKPIYGDNRSSEYGKKALIKAGADGDVFDLVENSRYVGGKRNTKDHTDADYFDYFVKTVQIDGKVFDLVADVEKKYGEDGGFVYTLALRDNKTIKASPTHGLNPVHSVGNAFSNDIVPQNSKKSSGFGKFSLSDSDGKALTNEQSEYFKDSKMRDDNGNLKVMYHGSQDAGFHVFDSSMSDDGQSFFFVDSNDVAASYSGTSETYEARTIRNAEDMNNFIEEIGAEGYEVVEKDGKFTLLYEGERVADSNTAKGIYEEFCWYEGVGEGDANYKVYLNLKNPLVVDAEGRNWNNISREYSQEIADRFNSLTAEEKAALANLAEWGEYGIFKDEMLEARANAEQGVSGMFDEAYTKTLARAYEKLGGANANLYDAFSIASDNFSEESIKQFAVKQMNTRDYATKAKAEGYDGVIFKNIVDVGGYGNGSEGASTVAVAFSSEQVKSVANENPTGDPDIRYSLTEYTEAEKKTHNDMVLEHFGKTYKWAETGYLLLDGTRLDLSGKHDGAPGGYRTVDHRDITEALGYDYGGGDYSGSLIQFMSEGNIRIIPEINGINMSVKPTKAQEQSLADFISRNRGEIVMDIDDANGYTVVSVEYPRGTYYTKVLNDIREWFDNGKKPETAGTYSLTKNGDTPKKYGDRYTPAAELRYEGESIAPMRGDSMGEVETANVTENTAPTENAVQSKIEGVTETEENVAPEGFAPITEDDAEAMRNESFNSLDNSDIPPEVEAPYYGDNERVPVKLGAITADNISRKVGKILSLDAEGRAQMNETIQRYAADANLTESDLFDEIQNNFLYSEEVSNEELDETLMRARQHMRGTKVFIDPTKKADFAGLGYNSFNDFKKAHFGHFYITTQKSANALSVDQLYRELTELYPGLFPDGEWNVADQLKIMGEVADNANATEYRETPYDDDTINEVVDIINKGISEYSERETLNYLDTARENYLESVGADDIAPVAPVIEKKVTESAAPSFDTSRKNETYGQQTMFREPEVKSEQPIKTVKDRLQHKLNNAYGELSHNKRLRREAIESYNEKIANLMLEYDSKGNKDTKVANDILRRIERLTRLRDDVDADYTKRINDLRANVEKAKTKLEEGYSDEEGRMMRSELHAQKVDEIKNAFSAKGLDFDSTLKNAKDLNTFRTVDNTPQRVMEKSLGYKGGQVLADLTVNKVAQNESEGIKWLNTITSRQGDGGLLKKLSKQYNIKPGSKESAAAQMYAEGFYVNDKGETIKYGDAELAKDFPNAKTQKNIKGLAKDSRIRQFYDDTLIKINESRTRNAYPEIKPLDNYFLHFRAMDDTFSRIGIPFNPNDIKAKDLPTDLNGVTADLKPGQPYFASAMHRRGNKTTYDLLGGMERYATGAKNQIYHIDDIQTLRALRNYIADTYGQANGLDNLDNLSEEEVQDRIKQVYSSHLSTFAKFLNEEANVIAGKTALIDRGLEGIIGRRGIQFLDTINKQVGSNMVGMNVSSSLTNFIAPVQAFAKTNKTAFVKGFAQTVANKVGHVFGKADTFADNPTAIRRKGADRFYRTPWQKVSDVGYTLMSAVDNFSTEVIVRAKYNEYIKNGMSEQQAITEADKWASRLMGDRSLGQMPQLYNSKMLGLFTKFQLEVRNQLDSQFYDTIQETKASNEDIDNALKKNAKTAAKVAATFAELAIAQHIFGKVFESIAGYNPAFDIIDVIIKALGFDDDEDSEDTALDNLEQGFLALVEDLPYSSIVTDGGRIPISSALPIGELVTGEDEYGNEKSRLETLGEIAPYYLLPTGYSQIKKTVGGLSMFSDEHPIAGSYTDSGNLRFPVDDTLGNRIQAGIFGQWANKNARDYFDNERAPLKEKQIEEFDDVGMTIQEYWKYREGLAEYDTLAEKAEYINDLDLSTRQKNILINNIANREEDIDMSDYDDYDSFDEFDFAVKNPEKYKFFNDNGISYEEYNASEESRDLYNWAYRNPERITMSKAVGGLESFKKYSDELYDIKGVDNDGDGRSDTGTRKEKVLDYINNLDIDYYEKLILFKNEYNADDTYNMEIIEYLNSREDISYKDMETILKELGFTVDSDGNIYWD